MNYTHIHALYWSATGHTRQIVHSICHSLSQWLELPIIETDFTLASMRHEDIHLPPTSLVVIGMPTYAGKLPNKIMPFIQDHIHGVGTYALTIVTYGNRSFDNALAELCYLMTANHFHIIAAALVCQHAFCDTIASGRPNADDFAQIQEFLKQLLDPIQHRQALLKLIPGDPHAPYYVPKGIDGNPVNFLKAKPMTDPVRCDNCGLCAKLCPMQSIDQNDPSHVPGICIKCQRCVQICPKQAKFFEDPTFLSHVKMLEEHCQEPKKNQFFF